MATSQAQRNGPNSPNRKRRQGGGGRSGNQRSRNRQGGGSGRSGGYVRSKVPRRAPEPSFAQRLLKILSFGLLGGKLPEAPRKPAPAKRPSSSGRAGSNGGNRKGRSEGGGDRRARHSPEIVEVTTGRLYVGNLSYDAAENDLIDLFNGVGSVSTAEVVSHRHTQRSKGYAFVVMNSVDEAKRAVEVLHDKDFMGRKLVVSGAKSPGIRNGGGEASSD